MNPAVAQVMVFDGEGESFKNHSRFKIVINQNVDVAEPKNLEV